MKYRIDYVKNGLHEKKYLNVNSNFEALTEALALVRSFKNVQIVRLENIMTGELLIRKPDLALDVLDLAAKQLTHHLDQEIIDRVFVELSKISS